MINNYQKKLAIVTNSMITITRYTLYPYKREGLASLMRFVVIVSIIKCFSLFGVFTCFYNTVYHMSPILCSNPLIV